jgi:hypothetical protein
VIAENHLFERAFSDKTVTHACLVSQDTIPLVAPWVLTDKLLAHPATNWLSTGCTGMSADYFGIDGLECALQFFIMSRDGWTKVRPLWNVIFPRFEQVMTTRVIDEKLCAADECYFSTVLKQSSASVTKYAIMYASYHNGRAEVKTTPFIKQVLPGVIERGYFFSRKYREVDTETIIATLTRAFRQRKQARRK